MASNERLLRLNNFINARVCVEDGLHVGKGHDRAVSTTDVTTKQLMLVNCTKATTINLRLVTDGNGVVEDQTNGLVGLLATLASVEQILLNVISDGKQRAARRVNSGVLAVGAKSALGQRRCKTLDEQVSCNKERFDVPLAT